MMEWLRWYQGTATDPKWRVVAIESGQPVAVVLAVWAMMLERAAQSDERGTIDGWSDRVAGAALDVPGDAVTAVRSAMQCLVLDGDRITGWEKRQPKREDGSAERAKAWRDRKKNATEPTDPDKNGKRTHANANERTRTLEEIRGEERTTTATVSNETGAVPRAGEAQVIDLQERRPSAPPDPAVLMMPYVRKHFRLGQGWPGRNHREKRQAEGRCLGVLRELLNAGVSPETVAEALRGAVLLRDRGDLQREGWVRVDEPINTRILLHKNESGPCFWQRATDAYRRSLEPEDDATSPDAGGLQPVVVEIRRAG
jgi:hypothetical protein